MDLGYYRGRESHERAQAARSLDPATRASHLNLAERYSALIAAYEDLVQIVPVETRPVEIRPAEIRPAEIRPVETRRVESRHAETRQRA